MEFPCAGCGKRLRVPDTARNPKVRCPRCGYIFRPFAGKQVVAAQVVEEQPPASSRSSVSSSPRPAARLPSESRPTPTRSTSSPAGTTRKPSAQSTKPVSTPKKSAGGFGIGFFILLMVLSRAPRMLERLFDKEDPPPAPVEVEMDPLILEAVKKAAEGNEEEQPIDENGLPEDGLPEDPNQELDQDADPAGG